MRLECEHLFNLRIHGKEQVVMAVLHMQQNSAKENFFRTHIWFHTWRIPLFVVVVNCAFIFWEMFHLKTHHNCQHFKSIPFKCSIHLVNFALLQFHESYTWISFFNQLFCYGWKVHTHICLHSISIPEGWKVKEEESHSISNDEQVQDRISFSRILG